MAKDFQDEISKAVQYFVIVLFALFAPYLKLVFGSASINLTELWKAESFYVSWVLVVFVVITLVRLFVVFLTQFSKSRSI